MDDKQFDKIVEVNIEDEMRESYIDYAMSVIVARALPDVRDGLKPVHRRILYAMNELNLDPAKGYRKSARIVGDTMGKYHPHGNSSIYDAMVRLAQEFSTRYLLVDGHGNFGSIDGDGAAAERYTEARLTRLSVEMLNDIEKETVDFLPNFDNTLKEPTVLPSHFPNLLVNGSSGIAVGMATNIPPHNLTESINGVLKIIDNDMEQKETDIAELLQIIKGPDFPTGATILGVRGIKEAYLTGRGKVTVRAKVSIEPMGHDREQLIVTELPYQVNKAKMVEKIADLVRDKKVEGISDIRDESNRDGIRVVIELKKDTNTNVVLNQLYKYTQLQDSFGIIMLALVDNEPKVLTLYEMLRHYINHQKEVVLRRTKFDLEKAQKRAHILQGLIKALGYIDEVLNIIRGSKAVPEAKDKLIERFEFSDTQAQAIVDLRFRALTGLEREKLEAEFNEIMEQIKELELIINNEHRLLEVVKEELLVIKTKYGDERRSEILLNENEIDIEDLIDDEPEVITLTLLNYIKRTPLSTYRSQNRGGKGIIGMQTRDNDFVKYVIVASTKDNILLFTTKGKVYRLKVYEIPETGRNAKGMASVNLLDLSPGEKISAIMAVNNFDDGKYLMMTTKNAVIKKSPLNAFANIRKGGLIALSLKESDELISVLLTDGNQSIYVGTSNGMGIMFHESDVRCMGRNAAGVRAIRLNQGDTVVAAEIASEGLKILSVTSKGFGKCTSVDEFKNQRRGGKGLKSYKVTAKTGTVIDSSMVNGDEESMLITSDGIIIRIRVKDISSYGRVAQGVKLMNIMDEKVEVVSVAKISKEDIESEEDTDIEDTDIKDIIEESDSSN